MTGASFHIWQFICEANLDGLAPHAVEWPVREGVILRATFDHDANTNLLLSVTGTSPFGEITEEDAQKAAAAAANRLAVIVGFPIGRPVLVKHIVDGIDQPVKLTQSWPVQLLRQQIVDSFENCALPSLELENPQVAVAAAFFGEALLADDDFARYILFWQVLLCLTRNQKGRGHANADGLILNLRPGTIMITDRNGDRSELRILRDKISHIGEQSPPEQIDIDQLRRDVKRHLPELEGIAREAILRNWTSQHE